MPRFLEGLSGRIYTPLKIGFTTFTFESHKSHTFLSKKRSLGEWACFAQKNIGFTLSMFNSFVSCNLQKKTVGWVACFAHKK